ncbi:hypothetical protein LUZ63_005185 [Rhynchospora breviuscula]|uniref:Uncharacterized protein n=1 Tax=Rhynchospora breviuscula TaxID=2022672 RepID=A0A9Q0HSW0_9POAL|nr:hypothetical protein LUZ63_005185 [Rhynchospora breviuscula]
MDPNPTSQPILSYVLTRLPPALSFKRPQKATNEFDVEQPPPPPEDPTSDDLKGLDLEERMPGLKDPALLAAMSKAVTDVAQNRSVLGALGPRPDHEAIDKARARMAEIDACLSPQLEDIVLSSPHAGDADGQQLQNEQAQKEKERKEAAEKELLGLRALIQLDEMHEAYEVLLKDAEERLDKIYYTAMGHAEPSEKESYEADAEHEEEEVNEEVIGLLEKGKMLDRVDLSDRGLKRLPDAFGKLSGLVYLNLSGNQLETLPDAIGTLDSLEELRLTNNILTSLPDSIGLMMNLKILDVSGNKLKSLPDSICHCRSLVDLDASYNQLAYLPTNIGFELVNLQKLRVHLNKLRSLPTSVGEMTSLRLLDAHFNELRGLPSSIGKLQNLETLNLSSNFSDLQELPITFGDLINLKELDLSNNQIHSLPDTFGRLENLEKLNLDQNPLSEPPADIIKQGVGSVKEYMSRRWLQFLIEEEEREKKLAEEATAQQGPQQLSWMTRSVSSVNKLAGTVVEYLSPRANRPNRDSFLDQQF